MAVTLTVIGMLFAGSVFAQSGVIMQKPFPETSLPSPIEPLKIPMDGTKLYAFNFYDNNFLSLDLPGYTNRTSLLNFSHYPGGVDFDESGDLYVIRATSPILYKVDFDTATVTELGTVIGLPSQYLVGLAYDAQNHTMYCLQSSWGTSGSLYTIDLTNLTATLIGTITGMTHGESLAFNLQDHMLYAYDFKPDQSDLLRINPATASAIVVGSTTAFLNYTYGWFGDSDFNDLTGELIFSTFNPGESRSSIWSIDASNSNATLVSTQDNAQLVLSINTNSVPISNSVPIPALSDWGLVILLVLIIGSASLAIQRRSIVRMG